MEFEYQIQNNQVILQRCYGEEERIRIPEQIDGLPVTILGAYAFSQARREPDRKKAVCAGQLKEVILPDSLLEIKNYAFYGCYALERMTFSHKIRGIGGGVFTGCHRLKNLTIRMKDACGYSMKNILGELHHELKVELLYEDCVEPKRCELLFPEFYEEAVENTPARNVDMAFHGSGYTYRQCFQDGRFQFSEYDASLITASNLESEDFCIELCLLRLLFPKELGETARGIYMSWLMEHRISAATWCIEFEQMESLELLSSFIDWTEGELELLIKNASSLHKMESLSFLMDYKHRHFKKRRVTFEL